MKPTVSIITPTYNHEGFIGQCIESTITQTYQNWEQIIIDDNSQDRTYKIALDYSKKDKRVKVIKHNKNWGIKKLANTYNQALRLSKAEYIAILEGDDFWPRDKLEKQIESLRKKDAVFSYGDCIMTSEKGLPIKLFTYHHDKNLLNNNPVGVILTLFANLNFSVIPVTVVIKRDALISIGGFVKDSNYPFTDIPTFLHLALKGKFCYQNDISGYYRKQQDSSWFNFARKTSAMGREEIGKCINSFLEKNRVNAKVKKIIQDEKLFSLQNKFVQRKKTTKKLSLFLNFLAFKLGCNPLVAVFAFQYILYKIKKKFI